MYKVVKTIRAGNNCIEKANCLANLKGWSVSKPYKHSIMCVLVTCRYESDFKDKEDYESNSEFMTEQFEKDLISVGFTKDYIDKNTKTILPKELVEIDEEKPRTFRDWQKRRKG